MSGPQYSEARNFVIHLSPVINERIDEYFLLNDLLVRGLLGFEISELSGAAIGRPSSARTANQRTRPAPMTAALHTRRRRLRANRKPRRNYRRLRRQVTADEKA